MASIFKTVPTARSPQFKSAFFIVRCNSNSFYRRFFGSDSCDNDKGSGKDETIKCLCPSSGDTNNPSTPTIYDSRKFGHNLSTDSIIPCFETLPDIPTGVFRCTTGEVLGTGAGKCAYYQNPEYFSYHHMSFYDLNLSMRQFRRPSPKTGRKPV